MLPNRPIRSKTHPAELMPTFRACHCQYTLTTISKDRLKILTSHMITPRDLLHISLTPRTLLRRLLDQRHRRLLLRPPLRPICPIIELRTRLALVPAPVVLHAVQPLAGHALELGRLVARVVDLA